MAAKKLTPQEIATLKIFSAYASKAGDKPGSKGYSARLADLTSNISYERAKTKKPVASVVAPAKPVVAAKPPAAPAKPSLRDVKASKDAAQKVKNAARLAEIKRNNAAQKAKNNSDGTKKK